MVFHHVNRSPKTPPHQIYMVLGLNPGHCECWTGILKLSDVPVSSIFFFEAGSHCGAQSTLDLEIFLLQRPKD